MKEKWREYGSDDFPTTWTRHALFALVSDRAGECEDIPPAEWRTPLAVSGEWDTPLAVSQFCQKKMERYSGGITGEKVSVASVIASEFYDLPDLLFGDDLLVCRTTRVDINHSINHSIQNIALESACWPNENPISGDRGNYVRLTMKGPLLCEKLSVLNEYWRGLDDDDCWPCDPPLPMEFTNATIVMDWRICSEEEGVVTRSYPWPATGARIVDPPPP